MSKQINVYSTKGKGLTSYSVENINTFAELKKFFDENEIEYANFNVTQSETKTSLTLDSAVLMYQNSTAGIPTCTIVLTPKSQKAGN